MGGIGPPAPWSPSDGRTACRNAHAAQRQAAFRRRLSGSGTCAMLVTSPVVAALPPGFVWVTGKGLERNPSRGVKGPVG